MLRVEGLSKAFKTAHGPARVLDNVSFELEAGETLSLVGPSGCGKTTSLRCVAGLEHPDSGRITIDGQVVFDAAARINVPAHRRPIAMVFQSYAIWPHMTVFDNVAYPLRVGKPRCSKDELRERVQVVLKALHVEELVNRNATALSGGQQQRVAVARALVRRPKLILLDEPLSNLDAKLRDEMRFEFHSIFARSGVAAVYVTHDLSEALVLSHRINVMNHGRIVQTGTPEDVYFQPKDPFVAEFMGGGNIFPASVRAVPGRDGSGAGELDLGFTTLTCRLPAGVEPGGEVLVVVRPEGLQVRQAAEPADLPESSTIRGRITVAAFLGRSIEYRVAVASMGQELRVQAPCTAESIPLPESSDVVVTIAPEACLVIAGPRVESPSTAPAGGSDLQPPVALQV